MPAYPGGLFGSSLTPQVPGTGAGGTAQTPFNILDATAQMAIGSTFFWNGMVFRYVKFDGGTGAVDTVVGGPALAVAMTPSATATALPIFTVTADLTDSILEQTPVGVFGAVIVAATYDNYFTAIQIGGVAQCVLPGGVEADTVTGGASDNIFARIAAGSAITRTQVGIRLEGASAAGLSPVLLMNMDW